MECFVPVKNAELYCQVVGAGKPAMIVLHGGPGLGCNYLLPQMRELADDSAVIFYDQRGTGKSISDNTWQDYPFKTYIEDLEAIRAFFELDTFTLLSHSWGSILSAYYAATYPWRIHSMIYVNSVPISSTDYFAFVKHRSEIVNQNKSELDALHASPEFAQGDPTTIEKYYRTYFKSYFAKPELADTLTLKMSPEAAINNFKIYDLFLADEKKHPFDLYPEMKKINKKSLIVAGDKDVIPLHYMEKLHTSIPASELVFIKNCGHFSYIDQPEILFQSIKKFLASIREQA